VVQIQNASRPAFIIFHGRLVNSKGLDILLQALATLRSAGRSFELSVIGDGPERPALENLARKLGLTSCVRFAGRLSASEMESALANARMVVMPSLGGEVFGLVLAENMSRGLAVVASDLGALAEVLGDAGLTFRTGDASDLARQLVRLFDDPELAPRLALRARQRVLDLFSPDGMVEAHAKVYRRMLLQD
jgi:glycosyltransferase involved in cell wall biosynthesis